MLKVTKTADETIEIAILCYPGAQLAAIHGLTDLFLIAEKLRSKQTQNVGRPLRVSHWEIDQASDTITCTFDTHNEQAHHLHSIILPPSLEEQADQQPDQNEQKNKTSIDWLTHHHSQGASLCSVCAGAFFLAESGLLDNRTITTHWSFSESFSKRFPQVNLNLEKLIIDDGDILTAGGLMAWTDLGLNLLERYLGPAITLQTARFLLIDPAGREQQYYRHFTPRFDHQDPAILQAQHYLQKHIAQPISVEDLALKVHIEKRTFLRRFQKATGFKPTAYIQQMRVEQAREKLELTALSIEKIAWEVGYTDTGAFRKVFQKIVGLTPSDYRQRFGLAG